jgi:hypothetical protein
LPVDLDVILIISLIITAILVIIGKFFVAVFVSSSC